MQAKWILTDLHKTCDIIISVRRRCYGMTMQNVSTVLITQENGKTMSHISSLCQRTAHKRVRSNLESSLRSSAILPSMSAAGLLIPFTSIANLHLNIIIYRSVQKFTLITTISFSTFYPANKTISSCLMHYVGRITLLQLFLQITVIRSCLGFRVSILMHDVFMFGIILMSRGCEFYNGVANALKLR